MSTETLYVTLGLLVALVVDMLLGIVKAVREGTFKWSELPATLKNNVLPYVVPVVVLGLVASIQSSVSDAVRGIFLTFSATYGVKLVADIYSKLSAIYGIAVKQPEK